MRSTAIILLFGAFLTHSAFAAPVSEGKRDCPELAARDVPKRVEDLRPDDFSVIMALGDSISAGLFAVKHDDDSSLSKRGGIVDEAYGVSHTSKSRTSSTPPAASASSTAKANQANAAGSGSGGYVNNVGPNYHNWHKMTEYGKGWQGNTVGGNAAEMAVDEVKAHGGWKKIIPGARKRELGVGQGEGEAAKRGVRLIEEFRGRSFVTGGDEGVGSLGNVN